MSYLIHDADPELWAWVKGRAHVAGVTINDFVLSILIEARYEQTQKGTVLNKLTDERSGG